jgi:maleylacetoacetate isomerase
MLKLYSYFRSSASYRARIALHWKNLPFEYIPVHLLKNGGEQRSVEYRHINPMGHVPALVHDGFMVAETMAILEYLDAVFPQNPLFPPVPQDRARVIQICEVINSGIQPLQNLKVQKWLEGPLGVPKAESDGFVRHWIEDGFANLERLLERTAGTHCMGGQITAADCFVIPQVFAARRFGIDVAQFPNIHYVNEAAIVLPAFVKAHPEKQPDYRG